MLVYVQFFDSSMVDIISYFCCKQDDEVYPNQDQIDTSDARWHTYYYGFPLGMREYFPEPT